MRKSELLKHWDSLGENQNPLAVMNPISPKHKGKTYGLDGIRIDGSQKFIDAVLSCLKPMLAGENTYTRLNLAHTDCSKAEPGFNKGNGGFVCYIRLYERGHEAQMAGSVFGSESEKQNTLKYAETLGIAL